MHELLQDEKGKKLFLLGNEAIVRGALEAGLNVSAAYPGTPSSEIGNNLYAISKDKTSGIYFEFSVNEKISMEVAATASATGLRSLTCLKHVGLNVASDVLMTLSYLGTKGGMVIVNADDPSMHSSQNEQDNRMFAKFAGIPILEPTNPQEAKDMVIEAFELSEKLELPVMLRTTTRISHARGIVELGSLPEDRAFKKGKFIRDPKRWVPVPAVARERHKVLLSRIDEAQKLSNVSKFNVISGNGKKAIISSGVAACYAEDAIFDLNISDQVSFLRLGFPFPLPKDSIVNFLKDKDEVLVVEELEPFIEDALKNILYDNNLNVRVYGKATSHLPKTFEFNPLQVKNAISKFMGISSDVNPDNLPDLSSVPALPMRPPSLCKGCPHTETYMRFKEALKELGTEENTIYPTDIGCYTLGLLPPIQMADFLLCMGSSIGSSAGFSVSTDQKILSFIGDSTFFHSGVSSLINAVFNNHSFCLVVLDNSTTAMTGHQPHPGMSIVPDDYDKTQVPIENVIKGIGIKNLFKINPYKKDESIATIKEALQRPGVTVVISESPCILYYKKVGGKK